MNIIIAVAQEESSRPDTEDAWRAAASVKTALIKKGWDAYIAPIRHDLWKKFPEKAVNRRLFIAAECIVNFFEGFSSDSHAEIAFANILENLNLPFTGNPSAALALCLDKNLTKKTLEKAGINTPRGVCLTSFDDSKIEGLRYPLFVKPCCEDASLGIDALSLCPDRKALEKSLAVKLEQFPKGLIIEEFITGPEYAASFIGGKEPEMIALSVIDYTKHPSVSPFLSYASKWDTDDKSFSLIQPSITVDKNSKNWNTVSAIGKKVAEHFGCRGYYRIDFREKDNALYVIDINPNPDLNEDAGFAKHAYQAGYTYTELLTKIIQQARHR
jgi:D-alanine-D-alanine ligase